MNNTFELKKGKLVFEADKIVISDNAGYEKWYRLFSFTMLLFLGISFSVKYLRTGEDSSLRTGLLFTVVSLVNFAFEYFKSSRSEISYKDVKSFKVNRIFSRDVLFIRMHNNKTRRVNGIYNAERLAEYIQSSSFPI
jgi:hypothetical protein